MNFGMFTGPFLEVFSVLDPVVRKQKINKQLTVGYKIE